jgi:hypothetical protein
MVQAVSQVETLEIAAARNIAERPALMDQPVVHHKVERAVERHASANPLHRPHPPCSPRGSCSPQTLTAAVMEMMQALRADGLGTADHSAIACYYEKLAKVEITR